MVWNEFMLFGMQGCQVIMNLNSITNYFWDLTVLTQRKARDLVEQGDKHASRWFLHKNSWRVFRNHYMHSIWSQEGEGVKFCTVVVFIASSIVI